MFRATKGWADHEAVARDTAATIKSTGGAAKVTAAQVGQLADAIEAKTTKDGDAIQTGANMLLTFKNIRNEAGRGNDVFNQTTSVLTDMTAKMNQGNVTAQNMSSTAVQLGKALDDPVAGISALTRVGVKFTEQQKDQIKKLDEAGDRMGAQKIILKELASEFSGAAKASAKPWDGIVVALRKVEDAIGAFVLPKVKALSDWVINRGIPAFNQLQPKLKDIAARIATTASVVHDKLLPELGKLKQAWDDNKTAILAVTGQMGHLGTSTGVLGLIVKRALEEFRGFLGILGFVSRSVLVLEAVLLDLGNGFLWVVEHTVGLFNSGIRAAAHNARREIGAMRDDINAKLRSILNPVKIVFEPLDHGTLSYIARLKSALRGIQSPTSLGIVHGPFQHGAWKTPGGLALIHPGEMIIPAGPAETIRRGATPLDQARPSSPGGTVVLEIRSGGTRLDDLLVEVLRRSIRSKGGNVQVVLGN